MTRLGTAVSKWVEGGMVIKSGAEIAVSIADLYLWTSSQQNQAIDEVLAAYPGCKVRLFQMDWHDGVKVKDRE